MAHYKLKQYSKLLLFVMIKSVVKSFKIPVVVVFLPKHMEWGDSNIQIFSQNCQFHHRRLESLVHFNVLLHVFFSGFCIISPGVKSIGSALQVNRCLTSCGEAPQFVQMSLGSPKTLCL